MRSARIAAVVMGVTVMLAGTVAAGPIVAVAAGMDMSEHDPLVASVTAAGYTVIDVSTVAEAASAQAVALVAYAGGVSGTGMQASDLQTWVGMGRGLVQIGDWHDYFETAWDGPLQTPASFTVTINELGDRVSAGVDPFWSGHGYFFYDWPDGAIGWTTGTLGESDLATLSTAGYIARDHGVAAVETTGRAVYFGLCVYGPAAGPNDLLLLKNALAWVTGELFSDAFEGGTPAAWSVAVP